MSKALQGKTVAILATDGFEQAELFEPRKNLEQAGAKVDVISIKTGKIKGWNHTEWGDKIKVDHLVKDAKVKDYDALVLPGGVMNPDFLRVDKDAVNFVREFMQSGKPVAAICHGPWTLIEADEVRGKTITSWPSLQTDQRNAGANWVDFEVVRHQNLITSRKPDDIPAFSKCLIEVMGESSKQQAA
jgi:protease I